MDIRLRIRYSTEKREWLCFRHAVALAMIGRNIHTEIDDFDSRYYHLDTTCYLCRHEVFAGDDEAE